MKILKVDSGVEKYLRKRGLVKKFEKQVGFLERNPRYPGLRMELLEPKSQGIYSFRVDRKYRALFVFRKGRQVIEILAVTDHYQ